MVELTIEITGWCDKKCHFCSSDATEDGKPLDYDVIMNFIISKIPKGHVADIINISGGEPLSHPRFWDILELCKAWAYHVNVYTNAFDENTTIFYNASVVKNMNIEVNVPLAPDTTITLPKSGKIHLLKFIPQGRGKNIKPLDIHLSKNLIDESSCNDCKNVVLKADGTVVPSPCRKDI